MNDHDDVLLVHSVLRTNHRRLFIPLLNSMSHLADDYDLRTLI